MLLLQELLLPLSKFALLWEAFGIPAFAASGKFSNITLLSGVGACWLATPIGLLIAPDLWPLWAVIGGIAQGGGFTVIFMLMIDQSYDLNGNRDILTCTRARI